MANPFLRRATEYVRDDASFLAIVSPAPLTTFLANSEHKDVMFDLPARVIGEPGTGKTMLATLAEFKMIETILRDLSGQTHKDLAKALAKAGFLSDGRPSIAAVRVPMESGYRDFWELPYDPAIKTKLALWMLQARAVLGLFRNLTANKRRGIDDVKFVAREASEAHLEQMGGATSQGIRDRALEVQKAIQSVVGGLRPPKIENLPTAVTTPYQPFAAIQHIEIEWQKEVIQLKPLVMLDDVHALHPVQREDLFVSLCHREIKIGRWLMMRLDALSPGAVLGTDKQETHNLKRNRDYVDIRMQSNPDGGDKKKQFKKMAMDMANRYLPLVDAMKNKNATEFEALLSSEPPSLPPGKVKELSVGVAKDQEKLKITASRRAEIDKLVADYLTGATSYDKGEEVQLAMSRILLHRYVNRIQHAMPTLFETFDPDPKKPLKADSDVAESARLHLHEAFGRPFHFGVDDLCAASNENAELFLQFAGALVARMEARAIRNQSPVLNASAQQSGLVDKAKAIMNGWSFAYATRIRALVDAMAEECRRASLSPYARYGAGANAIGIPEEEMKDLLKAEEELAVILKHALANGAIGVRRDYGQGGKLWTLIELSGPVCLVYGLTFNRGGFLEKRVAYLRELCGVMP